MDVAPAVDANAACDQDQHRDFGSVDSVDEAARLELRDRLREVQRICEKAGRPVHSIVFDVLAPAQNVAETKRENAVLVDERSKAMSELS